MPELPEVHTTATMLHKLIKGLEITAVWTDYSSPFHLGKDNIKDSKFFTEFKRRSVGAKIKRVHRRAKNVLIDLDNGETIIVHMKMTGHLLYGTYSSSKGKVQNSKLKKRKSDKGVWEAVEPEELKDPFNQFLHFVISFDNGKSLALSDMRKFAKVTIVPSETLTTTPHLAGIGPEPLEPSFSLTEFKKRLLLRPNGKIKLVLMDPSIIAGIGNIYSDEMLWSADVHPFSLVAKIPDVNFKKMFTSMKEVLEKGIDFGGDSTSDYRNPDGKHGQFHYHHRAYRRTGEKCTKRGCAGIITRARFGERHAHFCPLHQTLYPVRGR